MQLTASMLYALSQGDHCQGPQECHWCCAPCEYSYIADDPIIPFVKNPNQPKRPGNQFICKGCWLYRRRSITVRYLHGGFKDRQCPLDQSWWITNQEAFAIRDADFATLYKHLLNPPIPFVLSLLDGITNINHIHQAFCNCLEELMADTPLLFTINNVKHTYTIYELEQAIQHGPEGKEPGVQALWRFLGPCIVKEDKRSKGRPTNEEQNSKSIRRKIR